MNKIALIIGNGQSTKILEKYGFNNINKNIDVYCTSLSFRFCDEYNFEPTYYVFADPKSVEYQKYNLKKYIKKFKKTQWYLCCNLIKDKNFFSKKIYNIEHAGSGPAALKIAIEKNIYSKILIIGLDHNYTWIKKYVKFTGFQNCAKYIQDVENHPSYFYSKYIRKNDIVSWDMNAKDNEKIFKRCLFTENLINKNKHIDIIDFSNNLLKCKKGKNILKYIN